MMSRSEISTLTEVYSARKVNRVRSRAQRAGALPEGMCISVRDWRELDERTAQEFVLRGRIFASGWSKSQIDPHAVLAAFKPLRIKSGFVLRADQYISNDDGHSVVWAVPESSRFLEPEECEMIGPGPFKTPRPAGAQDNPMAVIEGDDTPWSYMCASLLARELREIGALGHGRVWSDPKIIDGTSPWIRDATDWDWQEEPPSDWAPSVSMAADQVRVTFYTTCEEGCFAINRRVDTYVRGSFVGDRQCVSLVVGPQARIY